MGLGGQVPVKKNTGNASSMQKDVLTTLLALYFAEWRGGSGPLGSVLQGSFDNNFHLRLNSNLNIGLVGHMQPAATERICSIISFGQH